MTTFENLSIVTGTDPQGRTFGTNGDELAPGTSTDDRINLRGGNDILFGQSGNDFLVGLAGDDILFGGIGLDTVNGGLGDDRIGGDEGADLLNGQAGDDVIRGGSDRDSIEGGTGTDVMVGGAASDLFYFDPTREDEGRDRIADFELGSDKIVLDVNDVLATDPDLADAIVAGGGDVNAVLQALDDSDVWSFFAADDGDVIIEHPTGTIRLNGVSGEGATSFVDLKPALAIEGLGEALSGLADAAGNPATVADVVAASGSGFDDNPDDFDMLLAALNDTGLTSTLADESASFSVVAPDDGAFVSLAQRLGFAGDSESGALNAILDALAPLGGGDPIGPLTDVLTYHVVDGARTLGELQAEQTISPLFPGSDFDVFGNTVVDRDPGSPDAEITTEDIQTGNGVIQVLDQVLVPDL